VVAVVDGDRHAHRALALGVDEVVRVNEASVSNLSAAVERARLRAIGREARPASPEEDPRAMELLAASVSSRLANPLALASVNIEILQAAMGPVAGLADAYARSAASRQDGLPEGEAQRVVALRASAPTTPALHAIVRDLQLALREASSAVAHVYTLVATPGVDDGSDLAITIGGVAQLVRPVIERVANFHVELPRAGVVPVAMSRSAVVQSLSALLTNAVHAVRDRRERGTLEIRVGLRASIALVEVIDDGIGMSPSVLARVEDSLSGARGTATSTGLATAADHVRRAGGELVIESEQGVGTTARMFLPLVVQANPVDPSAN
jgi:signal transduction histidine kinase